MNQITCFIGSERVSWFERVSFQTQDAQPTDSVDSVHPRTIIYLRSPSPVPFIRKITPFLSVVTCNWVRMSLDRCVYFYCFRLNFNWHKCRHTKRRRIRQYSDSSVVPSLVLSTLMVVLLLWSLTYYNKLRYGGWDWELSLSQKRPFNVGLSITESGLPFFIFFTMVLGCINPRFGKHLGSHTISYLLGSFPNPTQSFYTR